MKKILLLLAALAAILPLTGCERGIPSNTVYSAADVAGKTVGVLEKTAAASLAGDGASVEAYQSAEQLASDLRYGVIDCVIIDSQLADSVLRAQRRIKTLSEPYLDEEWRFAIAKENADLTEAVNSALEALGEAGTLSAIEGAYLKGSGYAYVSPEGAKDFESSITLAADSSFPPYSYINEEGDWAGIDIDTARAVCDILGVRLEVTNVKRAALIDSVWHGEVQFAAGAIAETEEGLEKIDFSEPYTESKQVIIVRKKN